jgi:hypothetical protein
MTSPAASSNHLDNGPEPFSYIPDELKAVPQWVMWRFEDRDGKKTKIPYNPKQPSEKAKANDPTTWATFTEARIVMDAELFDGLGFEFTQPFCGIDYDHVRDPQSGEISADVANEIRSLDSYTEISPSGTGVHVILKGEINGDRRRIGNREMYSHGRFFTVTGNPFPDTPRKVNGAQEALDALYKSWFGSDQVLTELPIYPKTTPSTLSTDDEQILAKCQKVKNADKFQALWDGDTTNYPSQSEADLALCSKLAFHTRNYAQIDRLFRHSGLYRDKWDKFHGKYTYGALTIKKAIEEAVPLKAKSSSKTTRGEEQPKRVLPFFEKGGCLYLDVINPDQTFQFVHAEGDNLVFETETTDDTNTVVFPCKLPIHHDTGTMIHVVGVPRSDLVEQAEILEPAALYEEIDAHINRYADLPDLEREIAIYYLLQSWFYTKCQTAPYLRFLGDTGKGKSRILEVTSDLCFLPIKATGASSSSGIMRFHERWKGTLVIDESDLKGGTENAMIKFLNTGFERGKYLILSDKNDPNRQQIFDPFGPKVIAMREPFGDNATEGRCISYSPSETTRRDIPPELPRSYQEAVDRLRALITRFVLHNWSNVSGDSLIDIGDMNIERRLLQMARPISVVLNFSRTVRGCSEHTSQNGRMKCDGPEPIPGKGRYSTRHFRFPSGMVMMRIQSRVA